MRSLQGQEEKQRVRSPVLSISLLLKGPVRAQGRGSLPSTWTHP